MVIVPVVFEVLSASSLSADAYKPASTKFILSRDKACEILDPIPPEAPVIIAVCPFNGLMLKLFLHLVSWKTWTTDALESIPQIQ